MQSTELLLCPLWKCPIVKLIFEEPLLHLSITSDRPMADPFVLECLTMFTYWWKMRIFIPDVSCHFSYNGFSGLTISHLRSCWQLSLLSLPQVSPLCITSSFPPVCWKDEAAIKLLSVSHYATFGNLKHLQIGHELQHFYEAMSL